MNKQTEALKLALEALQVATTPLARDRQEVLRAITAIKEALAHPEQEPVALYENIPTFYVRDVNGAYVEDSPLNYYITPPQRKPLTDDEFLELLLRDGTSEVVGYCTFVGGSIQMQGRVGLLRSAKVIKQFIEFAYGIKE